MNRFCQTNGEWFYITRDGKEYEPFESKDEAEADLAVYVREKLKLHQFGQ